MPVPVCSSLPPTLGVLAPRQRASCLLVPACRFSSISFGPSYYRIALAGVTALASHVPFAGATVSPVRCKLQSWEGGASSNYCLCFSPSAIGYSLEVSVPASEQLVLCKQLTILHAGVPFSGWTLAATETTIWAAGRLSRSCF